MKQHWKKIVIAVVALAVVVVAGSFIYAKVINDAPDKLDSSDLDAAVSDDTTAGSTDGATDATDAPGAASYDTATDGTEPAADATSAPADADAGSGAASGVEGTWNATDASVLRYRVTESINGFDTEGVGETNAITGALTIEGTSVTTADFTVDMTTFQSDESRRDGQFNGRIMAVDEFPTGTFVLTAPIELGSIPAEGEQITATATGDLTLRGTTKSVTFDVTAQLENGKIGVLGSIPVLFADYNIPNPSFATISTEDNGTLEFILVFEQG